jgi:hypothetical protein
MRIGEIGPDLRHGRIEGERLLQVSERLVVGLLVLRLVPELGLGLAGVIDRLKIVRPATRGALEGNGAFDRLQNAAKLC